MVEYLFYDKGLRHSSFTSVIKSDTDWLIPLVSYLTIKGANPFTFCVQAIPAGARWPKGGQRNTWVMNGR